MDWVVIFALFVFMFALLCFIDATVFIPVNKDLYTLSVNAPYQTVDSTVVGYC